MPDGLAQVLDVDRAQLTDAQAVEQEQARAGAGVTGAAFGGVQPVVTTLVSR